MSKKFIAFIFAAISFPSMAVAIGALPTYSDSLNEMNPLLIMITVIEIVLFVILMAAHFRRVMRFWPSTIAFIASSALKWFLIAAIDFQLLTNGNYPLAWMSGSEAILPYFGYILAPSFLLDFSLLYFLNRKHTTLRRILILAGIINIAWFLIILGLAFSSG